MICPKSPALSPPPGSEPVSRFPTGVEIMHDAGNNRRMLSAGKHTRLWHAYDSSVVPYKVRISVRAVARSRCSHR
jgi:hypothetical protein